ncbi:MAG: hypothetical protein JSU69_05590 [Candidatus Zixiibacteriota bacterium]|nr:MAG: hypothetical protein JSU69_05590 [candidate division Zixibacteria bacterium]
MTLRVGRKYLLMLLAAVLIASTVATMEYSGIFKLEKVVLQPDDFSKNVRITGLNSGERLFDVPVERAVNTLIEQEKILRVDLDFKLPDQINISINDIEPLALVIAGDGRLMYSLDEHGHLLPVDTSIGRFDFPIITGVNCGRLYMKPSDDRLQLVVEQLRRLRDASIDFYLAISDIDMSRADYISINLDGLPFPVLTYAGHLFESIIRLKLLILDFGPDLDGIKKLDMRSEALIIAAS